VGNGGLQDDGMGEAFPFAGARSNTVIRRNRKAAPQKPKPTTMNAPGVRLRHRAVADARSYSLPLGFLLRSAMPTILRIGGLRVVIWPNDHRPAHVHVMGAGGEAVFNLNCPDGPPTLRESYGFRLADLRGIEGALATAMAALCMEWRTIHGDHRA